MYSKTKTTNSTGNNLEKINRLKDMISEAEVILVGAGAGLSTSAGLRYGGERFQHLFPEYIKKYNLTDMYSSAFYPFKTPEELWGYWCKHIYHNRYNAEVNDCYKMLHELISEKKHFAITTNADHLFRLNNFAKERLFYTQGDYGTFACSKGCHDKTYDNEEIVMEMLENLDDLKVPTELVPYCPVCNEPMTVNLRKDSYFVEDEGWHTACDNYTKFVSQNKDKNILFLELGIGYNTPSIIKYPFWQMTYQNENARYVSVNLDNNKCPKEIVGQALLISDDISKVIEKCS